MGDFNYWATARLRPGVSPQRAQAELNVVQAAISKQFPGDLDLHASLIPLAGTHGRRVSARDWSC